MNSVEILDKKSQLKKEALEITNQCKTEVRDMNDDEAKRFAEIESELRSLNDELEQLNKQVILPEVEQKNIEKNTKTTMKKEFRLLKTIADIANHKEISPESRAVIELGEEEMRKAGKEYEGQIQLPMSELRSEISVANEGEDVVVTDFTNILAPLRAKNVLVQAGANYMTGLVGDLQIPSMTASNVTWEGETVAAQDGAGTFNNVKLQPKRLTAYIDITKQFLAQDSLDAEALIRQDLVNAINTKLEATILGNAAGTSTQPQGIFYSEEALPTVGTFKDLCDLEADIEDANILGDKKYVMSNKARAALRAMNKSAKTTQLVLENNEIDGTPILNTSHIAGTNIAVGAWDALVIGQWGAIDLTVDPYTQSTNGKVRIVINAFFDAKVVRDGAIKVATVTTA